MCKNTETFNNQLGANMALWVIYFAMYNYPNAQFIRFSTYLSGFKCISW
jgi:hypothetical protein